MAGYVPILAWDTEKNPAQPHSSHVGCMLLLQAWLGLGSVHQAVA